MKKNYNRVGGRHDEALIENRIQLLFRCDRDGYLLGINEPYDQTNRNAPLVYICWGKNRIVYGCSRDINGTIKKKVDEIINGLEYLPALSDRSLSRIIYNAVSEQNPVRLGYEGPAYRFHDIPEIQTDVFQVTNNNIKNMEGIIEKDQIDIVQPFIVKVVGGHVVSTCQTVRREDMYIEAGVETKNTHRRQGYGREVVVLWARKAIEMGLVPLYSTSWDNIASISLARSIGLIQYGTELSIYN